MSYLFNNNIISNTAGTVTPAFNYNNATISITGPNPTISTDKNEINLDEVAETMKIVRERLLIIVPEFEKHEKYEALKKAYDHYKLIEAMIRNNKDGQK